MRCRRARRIGGLGGGCDLRFANGESPLGEDGGLGEDFVGDGVEEDDMLGEGRAGAEDLVGAGAVGPPGVDGLLGVAVVGPLGFVGVFNQDATGTDADDIVVEIDDGSGREGLDLDEVVAGVGFALADDLIEQAGLLGGAGAEAECEKKGG